MIYNNLESNMIMSTRKGGREERGRELVLHEPEMSPVLFHVTIIALIEFTGRDDRASWPLTPPESADWPKPQFNYL